jgi:hypothetical protein
MNTLEQITYDAGRHALADQEMFVTGIRQRAGTLLAAHAVVASFLGGTVLREDRPSAFSWAATATLVAGLIVAAVLLAPWRLRFAIDACDLYGRLQKAQLEPNPDGYLATGGFAYQMLHTQNMSRVRRMSSLLGILTILTVAQTIFWMAALVIN